jgi:hypothetical protein
MLQRHGLTESSRTKEAGMLQNAWIIPDKGSGDAPAKGG